MVAVAGAVQRRYLRDRVRIATRHVRSPLGGLDAGSPFGIFTPGKVAAVETAFGVEGIVELHVFVDALIAVPVIDSGAIELGIAQGGWHVNTADDGYAAHSVMQGAEIGVLQSAGTGAVH